MAQMTPRERSEKKKAGFAATMQLYAPFPTTTAQRIEFTQPEPIAPDFIEADPSSQPTPSFEVTAPEHIEYQQAAPAYSPDFVEAVVPLRASITNREAEELGRAIDAVRRGAKVGIVPEGDSFRVIISMLGEDDFVSSARTLHMAASTALSDAVGDPRAPVDHALAMYRDRTGEPFRALPRK